MTSLRGNMVEKGHPIYIVTGTSLANDLVTYTTSVNANLVNVGKFATHPSATTITQGFLLVDTGKRLTPGQQPNVPTFMIGVSAIPVDASGRRVGTFPADVNGNTPTGVNGFIDPNSPNVAIYSRDRSIDFNDNLYFSGATMLQAAGDIVTNASLLGTSASAATAFSALGGVRHRGPGVYSGGVLNAAANPTISSVTFTATNTNVTYVSATGVVTYTIANTFTAGQSVTVTGITTALAGNVTNALITSASSTAFTVTIATGLTFGTPGGSAVAVVTAPGLNVTGGGLAVSAGAITSGPITAATYTSGSGVYLYTATNTFAPGQTVVVSGVTPSGYNITAVIASATLTTFTINGTATNGTAGTATNAVGIATAVQKSLVVSSANTTVNGGLALTNGTVSFGVPTAAAAGQNTTLDLSVTNAWTHTVAGAPTYTIANSTIGCVFYIIATGDGTGRAITISQQGATFAQSLASTPASSAVSLVTVIRVT